MDLRNVALVLGFVLAMPGCLPGRLSDEQIAANAANAAKADAKDVDPDDVAGTECETAYDCEDKITGKTPCVGAACENGRCVKVQKPVGGACIDGDRQAPVCHELTCDAEGQCGPTETTDGAACGFGVCGNKCAAGECVPATAADYDDGNPCTEDFCNQGKEIVHKPITELTVACDDGDACTTSDVCHQGTCEGQALDCTDGIDCTEDDCTSAAGCSHVGQAGLCDDGNPCTVQACALGVGCVVTAFDASAACDDGKNCTITDKCDGGGSCAGVAKTCGTNATCAEADGACKCDSGFTGDGQTCAAPVGCGEQTVAVDVDGKTVCAPDHPAWGIRPESPPAEWFKDNDDGTVSDSQSKLMWQKADSGDTRNWADAKAYCQGLELGMKIDWRLPTRFELETIIVFTKAKPAVPTPFAGTGATYYWSVSPYQGSSSDAWGVDFVHGSSGNYGITDYGWVRCVR
jgi:hypothetical protein